MTSCNGNKDQLTGIIWKSGFDFGFNPAACKTCGGRCCRGESGRVWVDAAEIREIARFLGTNTVDLMQSHLQRIDNRLSIREQWDGEGFRCVFLECGAEVRCAIYPVRPRQCRQYPFWSRCRPPAEECPGIVPCVPEGPGGRDDSGG